jgi:hypothetical protein
MNEMTRSRAFALLKRMPSNLPWSRDMEDLYEIALDSLPSLLIPEVIYRAVTARSVRPTVPELLAIAAEMLPGPHPSPAEAWQIVEQLRSSVGIYCEPDPYRENVFREGEPDFPHGFIRSAVERIGGWRFICTGRDSSFALRTRFERAYAHVLEMARNQNQEILSAEFQIARPGTVRADRSPRRPHAESVAMRQYLPDRRAHI